MDEMKRQDETRGERDDALRTPFHSGDRCGANPRPVEAPPESTPTTPAAPAKE